MSKAIRWGILGASKFARQHMAPAIHAATGATLVAIATSDAKKAVPFQSFAPELEVMDSYEALIAGDDIDAVYIPLPNHLHIDWSLKALAAGKHVLCEKPVALQADEIAPLCAARDSTGVVCAEAYMIVHHPQWARAKSLYQEGAIGELLHVDGVFCYNNRDPQNIRNKPETGGGGVRDIGVYTIGATRWVTGQEPIAITNAVLDLENEVDVVARITAEFEGFTAAWVNSMRMKPCQEMVFYGSKGSMTLPVPFNPTLDMPGSIELLRNGERDLLRYPGVQQYVLQVEAFGRAIQGGAPFAWTLEDARGTQAVIDAIFDASRGKT